MSRLFHDIPPTLHYYLERIRQVRRAPWNGGWAPQKPVLLLTLLDLMDRGAVRDNRFLVDDLLFGLFRSNWRLLVPEDTFSPVKILRPLFHLQTDDFWRLVDNQGRQPEEYISSKSRFQQQIRYGCLDNRLFELLRKEEFRELTRLFILNHFFPERQPQYLIDHPSPFFDQLTAYEAEVLLDPPVRYGKKTFQYEGFLRSLAFRRRVLEQYRFTCCISGLQVNMQAPMVEAAHIIRHAETGDNSITNALALCPNLHTAFDYGLVSLSDDYRVLIGRGLEESDSPFNLRQFKDRPILLPDNPRFHPDPGKLAQHRQRFGFR